MTAPILDTKRLVCKPLSSAFLSEKYVSWLNDEEVNAYTFSNKKQTLADLEAYLKKVDENSTLFWAITVKETGLHIGNIKIDPINNAHGYGEYGIMIGDRRAWGKGYAKEASLAVMNYCFAKVGLRKINLHVCVRNTGAIALYNSLGFKLEGILKKHFKYSYGFDDVFVMAKLKDE